MTILEALRQPKLFGTTFADRATWVAWEAFLAATLGLPLEGELLECYQARTGRTAPPAGPAREAWVIAGRRGGKSRIAALVATWLATRPYEGILAAGEVGTLPIIAADRRQARTVMGYVKGLIHGSPVLAKLVEHETTEGLTLATRVRIEVHTASWRALRGYTCVGAVLDEVAFYRSDDSANPDSEIVTALRPAMATVPGALLLAISSPYARRGILWDTFARYYGKDGDVLVWQAPTRAMNPTVPQAFIDAAMEADEPAALAEYGAQFRLDLEPFVSREALEACTVPGRLGLPPVPGISYAGFLDPSGGSADSFTLAVAHYEKRGETAVVVLDLVAERRPPFSPAQVVAEFAALLKTYKLTAAVSDRYAGAWVVEAFAKEQIHVEQSAAPKSDLYAEVLPMLNSGRVELLDHKRLQTQILGLERRTSRAGRDSIDHAPGAHDDLANAVAGSLVQAAALVALDVVPIVRRRDGEPREPRRRLNWRSIDPDTGTPRGSW